MRRLMLSLTLLPLAGLAVERMPLWPDGKMPDCRPRQIAAMADVAGVPGECKDGFDPKRHRTPFLAWFDEQPEPERRNGICMILVSGGGCDSCCDGPLVRMWRERFASIGCVCVNLVCRTPRPKGLPFCHGAWADAQRAVRLVRREAKARGFDPERIGVIGFSAGALLATLLATSAQTPAAAPVDELDGTPCHVAFAVAAALPHGYSADRLPSHLSDEFRFDAKTAPLCLLQGGRDPFGVLHASHVYRQLRRMKIPAELHGFADKAHDFWGWNPDPQTGTGPDNWFENVRGFIRQMDFDGQLAAERPIETRFADDSACGARVRRELWPSGRMPDVQTNQCAPYLEWWMPKTIRTRSIQILYSGGSYMDNHPEAWDGVPAARRFLNARGMTVVTLKYRTPRPTSGIAFYRTAWQDLQRAIRLVKGEAPQHGLDPDSVGIWGASAGGHLTLLGALSSTRLAYEPIDAADAIPCSVRWAVAVYPAYVLTEGNAGGGNQDSSVPGPEFAFDGKSCPVLFLHGDADGWTAMNSVKVWERLAAMGVQGDLHTFAKREHCFMMSASPGTGSYAWLDRVWEFMNHKGYNASSETRFRDRKRRTP